MGKFFTIDELSKSDTARQYSIDNTPTAEVINRMNALIENVLDPLRILWGRPLQVNSGYRCPDLNRILKGAKSSQHLTGQAADITVGNRNDNRKLFDLIQTSGLEYDQLINESDYLWIHISYAQGRNRKQILHL